MTEQELYNEYRKSDCKSFTDFLINKITNLKTDYEVLSCSVGDFDELQNRLEEEQRKNNGLSDNLTKAKEIIKALLRLWNDVMTEETVKALIAEAEQFLQESE